MPLRHVSEEPQEFPFVASPSQSPRPMSRQQSLLNSSPASAQVLFGRAWQGTEEELQRKHEDEQRAYAAKRELCVPPPSSRSILSSGGQEQRALALTDSFFALDRLVQSLDEASVLVRSLATFNQNKCASVFGDRKRSACPALCHAQA